jgi:hypothetical protein
LLRNPQLHEWILLPLAIKQNAARAPTPSARMAQQEFALRYALPVREYITAVTGNLQEAEELTQGFFADIVVCWRNWTAKREAFGHTDSVSGSRLH